VQFSSYNNANPIKAISITQMGLPQGNDTKCDTYSHESFGGANAMWNAGLYALFPQLEGHGSNTNQISNAFDYSCVYPSLSFSKAQVKRRAPTVSAVKGGAPTVSAGSSDCHKAQFSINGAVHN